jgi:uncharacterized membrane protein YbhN (UPF0104 family)
MSIDRAAAWQLAKRALTLLFFVAVAALIARQASRIDWSSVLASVHAYPTRTLLLAAACAATSHAIYCGYDLIGRHQTHHALPKRQVAAIGFVSYAFNLNLGSLVGGVAFRYRLYSRRGLSAQTITQVLLLALLTNWLGYLLVGGLSFTLHPIALPPDWGLDNEGLRWLGAALLAPVLAYLGLCFGSKPRAWTWHGARVRLPTGRIALLQLGLSALNWLLIGAAVYTLMPRQFAYADVLAVLLVAAIAGVITHVPAGLGVLETVFVTLLSYRAPANELLAALIVYRAFYYLMPLALASALFFAVDRRSSAAGASA